MRKLDRHRRSRCGDPAVPLGSPASSSVYLRRTLPDVPDRTPLDRKQVVFAYSGGLDTACILKVLLQRGHVVVARVANVGQQEDFDEVAAHVVKTGASVRRGCATWCF